jgi:CRISPR-associated protein (TIGR03986 family)
MMSVKSNYNFVPAPSEVEVFKPKWAEQASHDIPFSDGLSGEIKVEIIAKTPIYIRNGHSQQIGKRAKEIIKNWLKNDVEPTSEEDLKILEEYLPFSNVKDENGDKKFFIPPTSLKGMVRNVLEMMSISRIKVANDIYSLRDIDHPTYKENVRGKNLKTGWLQRVNKEWVISECDYHRVDVRGKFFGDETYADLSAVDKYKKVTHRDYRFTRHRDITRRHNGREIPTGEVIYKFDEQGAFRGTLVFFGAMNNKKYEFIFNPNSGKDYKVSNDLIKRFDEIDAKQDKTLWQYFKKNKFSKIPVFFSSTDEVNVDNFGFSKLYKLANLPYLEDMQPMKSYRKFRPKYELDLAECIFGTVEDTDKKRRGVKNKISLKGRVFFGNGKVTSEVIPDLENVRVVLSSPKASYYPYYFEPEKAFFDEKPEIRGFKRYPIHTAPKESNLNQENKEIESIIQPLPEETTFETKIRFHNLRKIEVGALLSAITLHGNNGNLFHSIGSGKPLGYGKIKVAVKKMVFEDKKSVEVKEYLVAYEEEMDKHHRNWIDSPYLKELFAMSMNPLPENEADLVYPSLEPNEFKRFKNEGLAKYSQINGTYDVESEAEKFELEQKEKREEEKLQQIEEQKNMESLDFKSAIDTDTIEAYKAFKLKHSGSKLILKADEEIGRLENDDDKSKAEAWQKETYTTDSDHFDDVKKLPNQWADNKFFQFQEQQLIDIKAAFRKCLDEEKTNSKNKKYKNKFFKKGKLIHFFQNKVKPPHNFPWTDVIKWLGVEEVEKLFNELKP